MWFYSFTREKKIFLSPNYEQVTQLPLIFMSALERLKLLPTRVIRAKEHFLPLPNESARLKQPICPPGAGSEPASTHRLPAAAPSTPDLTAQAQPRSARLAGQVPRAGPRPPPSFTPLWLQSLCFLARLCYHIPQQLNKGRFHGQREFKGVTAPSDWHSAEAASSLASRILSYLGLTKQGGRAVSTLGRSGDRLQAALSFPSKDRGC